MKKYFKILEFARRVFLHYNSRVESWTSQERGSTDVDDISREITDLVDSSEPCMIARFGSTELDAISNYLGVSGRSPVKQNLYNFITCKCPEWWWSDFRLNNMKNLSGFFPSTPETIKVFSEMMLSDCKEVDLLGCWRKRESWLSDYLPTSIIRVDRERINPFFAKKPWTLALKGKKVLVIHPFAKSIISQYNRKDLVFPNGMLPDFKLKVIPAVQSLGGSNSFESWFDALDSMKQEMDKCDYDIVLLGCGAYGFPLAAHAKRMGKKAIHIGGALQLYFGIIGKRWESEGYKGGPSDYSILFNEYWVRPSDDETPTSANGVESGCYW